MEKVCKVYAEFGKTEELDDGTIKVWGFASTEAEDSDGEIITAEAMKAALPDYMKWGAVREMHDKKAAGTAIEAEVRDDGKTWFGAHIVDSEAVKKIKSNVYKAFSIGGKVTLRDDVNKAIIKGLKLIEVSLVDRPANPEAVFTMYKAESVEDAGQGDIDALAEMLNKGETTPAELIALLKAAKDKPTENVEERPVKKGMNNIASLAYLIKSLKWLIQDQQNETAREGDNSPVCAQLCAAAKTLMDILVAMTQEESAELMAELMGNAPDTDLISPEMIISMAAEAEIKKAGAKFSAETKGKLSKVSQHMKDAVNHLDDLGFNEEKAATGDVEKVAADETLAKANADLAKRLTDTEAELAKAKADLAAELAKPAPGKALLIAVISKSADTIGESADELAKQAKEAEAFEKMTGEEKALHQIKKMYANQSRAA